MLSGLAVKTLDFHCHGPGFDHWSQGTKIHQSPVAKKKKKKKKNLALSVKFQFINNNQCGTSLGFPDGLVVKNPSANAGDTVSVPRLERFPGEGIGYPLQYSCLENPMNEERILRVTVHRAPKSRIEQLRTHACGTSLAVQWLRFHTSTEGVWVPSLVDELRPHMPKS